MNKSKKIQQVVEDEHVQKQEKKPSQFRFKNKYTGVVHTVSVYFDYGSNTYKIVDVKNKEIWSNSFTCEIEAIEHILDICNGWMENQIIYDCTD